MWARLHSPEMAGTPVPTVSSAPAPSVVAPEPGPLSASAEWVNEHRPSSSPLPTRPHASSPQQDFLELVTPQAIN